MKKIQFSTQADADIDECFVFLAARSMTTAERFLEAVQVTAQELAEMPRLGSQCEFTAAKLKNLRRWGVRGFNKYVIYYRDDSESILIVRLLHGSRDRDAIFEQDEG